MNIDPALLSNPRFSRFVSGMAWESEVDYVFSVFDPNAVFEATKFPDCETDGTLDDSKYRKGYLNSHDVDELIERFRRKDPKHAKIWMLTLNGGLSDKASNKLESVGVIVVRTLMALWSFLRRLYNKSNTMFRCSMCRVVSFVGRLGSQFSLHLRRLFPWADACFPQLLARIQTSRLVGPLLEALSFIDDLVLGGAATLTSSLGMLLVTILLLSALKALGEM